MSAYQTTPFKATPNVMTPGMPIYLWGSFNDKTSPTRGKIVSTSGNGSTSTVVIQILEGNIPIVSALSIPLITVVGSANAAGAYNVTNATLLSISSAANPDQGVYTVTFAGSGSSAVASDGGQFLIPQVEVAEALAAGASIPAVVPYNIMNANMNQALTAVVSFPTLPTSSVIVYLQQAVQDRDGEYQDVAAIATVAGGALTVGGEVTIDPTLGRFFRFRNGTVVSTGSPSIIAKLLL